MKKPFEAYLLILLVSVLSINGLAGGILMLIDPSGSLLGMQTSWLGKAPFANYFIPGLILFLCNGLFPLLAILGLIWRPNWHVLNRINLYKNVHWGWTFSLYSGIVCMVWIVVQQFITTYFILQPVIYALGIAILVLALLPRNMRFYGFIFNSPGNHF